MNIATRHNKNAKSPKPSNSNLELQLQVHHFNGKDEEELSYRIPFTNYFEIEAIKNNTVNNGDK